MRKLDNKPTSDFEKFLEMANLTWSWDSRRLINPKNFEARVEHELKKLPNDFSTVEQRFELEKRILIRLLSRLDSEPFSHYILGKSLNEYVLLSDDEISNAVRRFNSFESHLKAFGIIIRQKRSHDERGKLPKTDEIKLLGRIKHTVEINLNAKGQIDFQPYDFLLFSDVDFRRVKDCENCENYFWASNLKQKFCSKKCSNFHHQRLFQADDIKRARYNEQRQNNYAYRKQQKTEK